MSSKIFDPHYWNLETTFKQIYNVPVYQRPYSWDKEQVDVLLEDLYNAYKENPNSGYYLGNIIVHDNNEKINGNIILFELVDGQQRITTCALLMLALLCITVKRGISENDRTVQNIKGVLWKEISRKYVKEDRTVNLNSIEKDAFEKLYDYCFDANTAGFNIIKFCSNYKIKNKFEERIFNNFNIIYSFIDNVICAEDKDDYEVLNFADYLLQNADFIVIETTCKENKVFSMFESINSKGKKLDEIDLIKTYIFSNLDSSKYSYYLQVWGNLIIETDDNLYDYLYTFIKAYICFYRQNISIINFKSICKKELLGFYHEGDISKALQLFLDDLYEKVPYYKMLSSVDAAYDVIKSNKFRFFYKVFTDIGYKHPKPLFFRTLIEYKAGQINKNDSVEIFVETIKFLLKFLSVSGKDSKDAISMFAGMMNEIYDNGVITKDIVVNAIAVELLRQGITSDKLKSDLQSIDAYEQNKKLTISILALFDSTTKDNNGKLSVSYDQAYLVLNNYTNSFSLDHLLVQTPEVNSPFMYYKDANNDKLILKENNDFPKDIIVDGMDYDVFTRIILNKIGNLRIYYKDKNSGRQNTSINLAEYPNFYTYSNVVARGKDIADFLFDEILPAPKVNMKKISIATAKKEEAALPKMDELIQEGLVKIGDALYITVKPEISKAILVDSNTVEFNGEKMSLNEWGCKVTGWKAIRIYAYVSVVGEIETLQQKRIQYVKEHNESSIS